MDVQPTLQTDSLFVERDTSIKIRHRNKLYYRFNHWPIWIFVFFIAPGPLTFDLFERGFDLRMALWLGPDEWFLIDEAGKDLLADCAKVSALHSAVGISHRNVAFAVTGPAAAAAINAGCPQDLSLEAFPVGAASRTILGKCEIVLLRTAADAFRVECWRSFSDYVFTFLSEAASDAAA